MLDAKRIAVLIDDGFRDSEVLMPLKAISQTGARVVIVGINHSNSYQSQSGKEIMTAEIKAEHVTPEDYNAIIITSLNSSTKIKNSSPVIPLIQQMDAYGKLIAAVCYGPKLLISANIVMGRRITSSYLLSSELKNAGAKWIDESVVKDNNIITSGKIADLPVFNLQIIKTLGLLNNNRYRIAEKQEFTK